MEMPNISWEALDISASTGNIPGTVVVASMLEERTFAPLYAAAGSAVFMPTFEVSRKLPDGIERSTEWRCS